MLAITAVAVVAVSSDHTVAVMYPQGPEDDESWGFSYPRQSLKEDAQPSSLGIG